MMRYYADVMPDNTIRACLYSEDAGPLPTHFEGTAVELPSPISWSGPTETSVLKWDAASSSTVWVETASLDDLKARKNAEINAWRATANSTTFPYAGKLIACDTLSRSDIDGVANHISLMGTFPDGFPNAWKATDNTYVPIPDIATFKDMYSAMTTQGTANFERSQQLKSQLADATTADQVYAVTP